MRRILLLLLLLPLTAGCDLASVSCTTIALPALKVYVKDGASGAALAGATVVARSGAYADSAVSAGDLVPSGTEFPVFLASERPGYYDVTVRKAGYRDWTQRNVRVDTDQCHVHTVTLTASLQPL